MEYGTIYKHTCCRFKLKTENGSLGDFHSSIYPFAHPVQTEVFRWYAQSMVIRGYALYFNRTFAYETYYYGIYFYEIYFYGSILLRKEYTSP